MARPAPPLERIAPLWGLGVRGRDVGAGDVVLADRRRIVRVLRLLAGVLGAGRAVRIEGRAGRILGVTGTSRLLFAGLVGLTVRHDRTRRPDDDGRAEGKREQEHTQHDLILRPRASTAWRRRGDRPASAGADRPAVYRSRRRRRA